jgi:hypothetical protein
MPRWVERTVAEKESVGEFIIWPLGRRSRLTGRPLRRGHESGEQNLDVM